MVGLNIGWWFCVASYFRFMGMRAALLTNNSSVQYLGSELGVSSLRLDELMKTNHLGLPLVDFLTSELLKKLA